MLMGKMCRSGNMFTKIQYDPRLEMLYLVHLHDLIRSTCSTTMYIDQEI